MVAIHLIAAGITYTICEKYSVAPDSPQAAARPRATADATAGATVGARVPMEALQRLPIETRRCPYA